MKRDLVLALDLGTSGNRAVLFDSAGEVVASAYRAFGSFYPQEGWVSQDSGEIWESILGAIREVLGAFDVGRVRSIGITNQRETTILWDGETGEAVYEAIVWQCRRTAGICERLASHREFVKSKTGLPLDAYFSASKIRWILDHSDAAKRLRDSGKLRFGTVDSWIIWKLTGGRVHATDASNASRTLLFNIYEGCYDDALVQLFGVEGVILPEVLPSFGEFGTCDSEILGAEIPIMGVLGDQQAGLFGQSGGQAGVLKATYGTGLFVMGLADRGAAVSEGLVKTVAWERDGAISYALEGSSFVAGSAVKWIRDELGLIETSEESERLALSVGDNGGVYFVPALAGLGAPHWDPDARGLFCGMSLGSSKAHLVRAVLEGIAFQCSDLIGLFAASIGSPSVLRVDGGMSQNGFLMQFQTDILKVSVSRAQVVEVTALGIAAVSGIVSGLWDEGIFAGLNPEAVRFESSMDSATRDGFILGWREALGRCLG